MFETFIESILSNIFEIIATAISLVVAYYVIPYIKTDLIPWLKDKKLYDTVKKFVNAAEKLAESGVIQKADKKAKVIELLEGRGIVVNETIEVFIESCVQELDMVDSVIIEAIEVETMEDETN